MTRTKLTISAALKRWNTQYHVHFTLNDVASASSLSRETLSRLSTDSSFSSLFVVCESVYTLYYDSSSFFRDSFPSFNFITILNYLVDDDFFYL